MLFFPLRTDAPIYHWPWVTLVLIVTNIATFVMTNGGNNDLAMQWLLEYGNGLDPVEWFSTNFLHFGIIHLVGNMVFLWGFGLVVEGKLGWWKYLLVYFGIGVAHAAIEQVIMLGYVPPPGEPIGSGGASGVIFGLLAMSVVWAPKNDVTCFFLFFIRVFIFDVSILTFSVYFIGWEILVAFVNGFTMSSEVIHLLGAFVGSVVAVALLKLNWVDCENWDLLAVLAGTYGRREDNDPFMFGGTTAAFREEQSVTRYDVSTEPGGELQAAAPPTHAANKTKTLRKLQKLLKAGKPNAALTEFKKLKRLFPRWQLDEADLFTLAKGLYKSKSWPEAVEMMEEYIERFPHQSPGIRLKLAGVLIQEQHRPQAALRVLDAIPVGSLSDSLEAHRDKIERRAKKLADDGIIELDGQSW